MKQTLLKVEGLLPRKDMPRKYMQIADEGGEFKTAE